MTFKTLMLSLALAGALGMATTADAAKKKSASPTINSGKAMEICRKQFGPRVRYMKIRKGRLYCLVG